MLKKIAIITLSAFALGGCTVPSFFTGSNAAIDTQQNALTSPSPVPAATITTSPDAELQAMPSTSTSNDPKSLEKDINNTQILPEDFSNIK